MNQNKENQYLSDAQSYFTNKCMTSTRSTSLHEENTMKFSMNKNYFEQQQNDNEKELKKRWQDIAKDWQRNKRDVKIFQLAEFGIPISARKQVWPLIVGNKLQITKELYNILQIQSKSFKLDQRKSLGRLSSFNHIKQDLGRTFKNEYLQRIFHPGGPLSENLQTILEVFCLYRPDIGYVQGMTYVGSILLSYFDDYQAFVIFSSLITHSQLISIFMLDDQNLQIIFEQFEKLIKLNIPQVYKLFKKYNINCTNYLLDWILTLFAKPLNPDIVGRIWDRMFFNGTHILWKCGIAILKILYPKFKDQEKTLQSLKNPEIKDDELLQEMKNVNYPFEIQEVLGNIEL
ncbi:unnamed protein product [Paramecium sonneborni]|uniref:Rab-GAP TBC domain-containing protein n=1 Tax=Paramecium sonneborni TaxID=65129 RepID=A0A8S1NA96_9CILI|nr:unnamed protein product [Paramecium sonneborni]